MPVTAVLSTFDFDRILDEVGRQVELQVVTRANGNFSGQESLSYASGSNIEAYFIRTVEKRIFEEMGLKEVGDAVMLSKYSDSVKKDDKIVVEGNSFIVKEALNVPGTFQEDGSGTSFVYTACALFLTS